MDLYEMAYALEKIGFKEVPVSTNTSYILDCSCYLPDNNIFFHIPTKTIHHNKCRRYSIESGDLKGTSVFLDEVTNTIYNASIVLPNTIQDMYWNAIMKLETVIEMPYQPDFSKRYRSKYAASCSREYDKLFLALGALLDSVEITPENLVGLHYLTRPFELDFFVLESPRKKVVMGDNCKLALIPKIVHLESKEFYVDYLINLPEKMQRLGEFREYWSEFVDGVCDSGKNVRQFYERAGMDWNMPVDICRVLDNLQNTGNFVPDMPESDFELFAFAKTIASLLGSDDISYAGLEPDDLDGKIDPAKFYSAAEGALKLYPENQETLRRMIPEIARSVGGIEFGMGVKYEECSANNLRHVRT